MSNINKKTLYKYTEPLINYFIKNKNIELSENILAKELGIKKNQMRLVLTKVRLKIPIILVRKRTYLFTDNNKELLNKEATKLANIIKEKKEKLNLIKKYL